MKESLEKSCEVASPQIAGVAPRPVRLGSLPEGTPSGQRAVRGLHLQVRQLG
jgi:hypothetical protein